MYLAVMLKSKTLFVFCSYSSTKALALKVYQPTLVGCIFSNITKKIHVVPNYLLNKLVSCKVK